MASLFLMLYGTCSLEKLYIFLEKQIFNDLLAMVKTNFCDKWNHIKVYKTFLMLNDTDLLICTNLNICYKLGFIYTVSAQGKKEHKSG